MSEDIPKENLKVPRATREPSADTKFSKDIIANLERGKKSVANKKKGKDKAK